MTRRRGLMGTVLAALVLFSGARTQAASPFDAIPQDALGFVLVNRMAETDVKVQLLLQQVQAPPTSLLNLAKLTLGIMEGIDEKGTLAFAVAAGSEGGGDVSPVILVPVADYAKILEQLGAEAPTGKIVEVSVAGERSLIAEHNGYAMAVQPSDRALLEKILAGPKGPAADVAPMVEWLDEADLAVVVTRHGVETLSTLGQAGLRQAKEELAEMPEEYQASMGSAIAMFDLYEKMLQTAGEEVQTYAAAMRIDDHGNLHLIDQCRVVAGGELAKMLNEIKPADYDLLTGLPSGPFVAAGAGVLPESLVGLLLDFSGETMKVMPELYQMDAEQVDQLMEVSKQAMQGLQGMSMMMLVGEPGDPIYSNMAAIERVADAKAFIATYRKTLAEMNRLAADNASTFLTKSEVKDVEVGGVSAVQIRMEMPNLSEIAATAPGAPDTDQIMEMLLGPGGKITMYLAAADEHTVVLAYNEESLLTACLDVVSGKKPGLSADKSLAKTAALLPEDAQWVGYLSPKGLVAFAVRMVDTVAPEAPGGSQIPPFPETSPIGFAAKTIPAGVMTHTVVPADVVQGAGEYVAEVQQTMMGGAEPAE